jgi:hypothetical protein
MLANFQAILVDSSALGCNTPHPVNSNPAQLNAVHHPTAHNAPSTLTVMVVLQASTA